MAASRTGFIQQLAVSYIANGYFFYVLGRVPEHKDPTAVDRKLIDRYGISMSKWSRARRKRAGTASVQYLRYGRVFVLLATPGEHRIFVDEASVIRDARREPLKVFGYAISHRSGHAHVRIEREAFRRLKTRFLDLALVQSVDALAMQFTKLPFEPYAPVRRQLLKLLVAVNRSRRQIGMPRVPVEAIRMRRRIVRPFAVSTDCLSGISRRQLCPFRGVGGFQGGGASSSLASGKRSDSLSSQRPGLHCSRAQPA